MRYTYRSSVLRWLIHDGDLGDCGGGDQIVVTVLAGVDTETYVINYVNHKEIRNAEKRRDECLRCDLVRESSGATTVDIF